MASELLSEVEDDEGPLRSDSRPRDPPLRPEPAVVDPDEFLASTTAAPELLLLFLGSEPP